MKEKVEAALKKIRPMLQRDGGNVELIDVEDGIVKVRLQGACAGCPMSQMTIKNGIERLLNRGCARSNRLYPFDDVRYIDGLTPPVHRISDLSPEGFKARLPGTVSLHRAGGDT